MSIISVKKYCVKGYRRISHRKGHGVHSPFVYTLITRVIEEDAAYYAYDEIKRKRDAVKFSADAKGRHQLIPFKNATLLFRIINRFKPLSILECGTSFGVSTMAIELAAPPEARITTVEADAQRRAYLPVHGRTDIRCGGYAEEIPASCQSAPPPGFIYVREHSDAEEYRKIFAAIEPYVSDNTFIMAEGMHKTGEIYNLFCRLARNDKIKVFMDMYDIALFIASPKLNKERYKESF